MANNTGWTCARCTAFNFSSNSRCSKCGMLREQLAEKIAKNSAYGRFATATTRGKQKEV